MKRSGVQRSTIRSLRSDEPNPEGEPRRYEDRDGYVRLRWKIGVRQYVERLERDESGSLVRTKPPKAKRIDAGEVVRLYREGMTQTEIAERIGCNHGAVSRVLARQGEQVRPHWNRVKADPEQVIALYATGLGTIEVAARLGTNRHWVADLLRQRGLLRRSGQQPRGVPSYDAEFKRQRRLVRRRSGGRCEAGTEACTLVAAHVHHRKLRSRGGGNEFDNLLDVCHPCHTWIHANVAAATDAGWMLHSWEGPPER